jgi:protein-glutamine gamma-glutamyltransferase
VGEIRVPRGWSAATFCFWGAATGHWIAALCGALLIEIADTVPLRWDLSSRHFERLADLTSLGFAGLSIYQFSERGLFGIYAILGAFPLCLLPLSLAQCYSTRGRIPLRAFVMSLRRSDAIRAPIDLRPICGCACLLAAATGDLSGLWYGAGAVLGILTLITSNRAQRYSSIVFALLLGCVVGLTGGIFRGLQAAQTHLSELMQEMITQIGWMPADADRTFTAIGTLGRLKLSDQIVLRLATPRDTPLPIRLTEARYQVFNNGIWRNTSSALTTIDRAPMTRTWRIAPHVGTRQLVVTAERRRDIGALALPAGSSNVAGDDLLEIQRHPLGTIVAEARPGFLRYTVDYLPQPETIPPVPADLDIPAAYREALVSIGDEIGAHGQAPAVTRHLLEQFFAKNFRYSLIQPGFFPGRTPLLTFLRTTRHGHCEYFASATTLLLRVLGIPARYVVGYLVDEYSPLEGAFIARARHAHAWSEAYIAGEWVVVDTTPSLWLSAEAGRAPRWQILTDLWSWQRWSLQRLRRGDFAANPWLMAVVPFLLGWLGWRLRALTRRTAPAAEVEITLPADLTLLFEHLARRGVRPRRDETTLRFLLRHWPVNQHDSLQRIVSLHYQARFGAGISPDARKQLSTDVLALLRNPLSG